MKISSMLIPILVSFFFISCSTKKGVISVNDLSDEKLLIIGLIEFDYTQLENKKISGVDVFIESEEEFRNFKLSKEHLPYKTFKKFNFINIIGDTGVYELCYKQKHVPSAGTDNLLSLMDMEKTASSSKGSTLQKYLLNDGKIINIGKIIVKYQGGEVENSRIRYAHSFHSAENDTIAMQAFKTSYPLIYNRYKNDIYVFKSELEECIEYILSNIPEGKALLLKSFIEDHRDRIKYVFKGLTRKTQEKFIEQIETFTFDELNDFLSETE